MKKLLWLILFTSLFPLSFYAQENLNVAPFFSDTYKSDKNVTLISLDKAVGWLSEKHISKLKSISVKDDPELADKIRKSVTKDGANAKSKEVTFKKGQLYFGFYFFGGSGNARKYLLFLNRRPTGTEKTTLMYMEGDIDSEQVKALLTK